MTASPQCIPLAAPRAVLGPCRRAVRRPEGARGAASFAMTDARQPAPGRNVGGGCCDFRMAKRDGKSRRPAGRHLSAVRQPERVDDIDIRNRYNEQVRWEILLLEPVSDWFLALCKDAPLTADKVEEALDELALCGPQLGRPLVDRIHGSKIHNLKELRPGFLAAPRCAGSSYSTRSGGRSCWVPGTRPGARAPGAPRPSRSRRSGTRLTSEKPRRRRKKKNESRPLGGHQAAGPRAEPGLGYSGARCVTRAEPCGDAR